MTWAEHLKAQGATEEEIKILDSAAARKAFDKMQADAAAAVATATADAQKRMEDYRGEVVTWQEGFMSTVDQAKANEIAAKAEAERAKAIVRQASESSAALKQVAINAGWIEKDGVVTPPNPAPASAAAGPKDYFTKDEVISALSREGDVIMLMQDLAAEHATLFPGQRPNWRELGNEARAAKKDLQAYWEAKYKVPEARAKIAADAKAAEEARIRKEERETVTREMADRYGNPALRPPMPSNSPFVQAAKGTDGKQPWERQQTETERVASAAARVKESLLKQGLTVQ